MRWRAVLLRANSRTTARSCMLAWVSPLDSGAREKHPVGGHRRRQETLSVLFLPRRSLGGRDSTSAKLFSLEFFLASRLVLIAGRHWVGGLARRSEVPAREVMMELVTGAASMSRLSERHQ